MSLKFDILDKAEIKPEENYEIFDQEAGIELREINSVDVNLLAPDVPMEETIENAIVIEHEDAALFRKV